MKQKNRSGAINSIQEIKEKTEKKLEKLKNKTQSEKDLIIVSEIRKKIGMKDTGGSLLLMDYLQLVEEMQHQIQL